MTSAKAPKVRQVSGSEIRLRIGLMNAVSNPSATEKISTSRSLVYSTRLDSKIVPTASTATMLPTM